MEFWGVEVKAGEPVSVSPEEGKLIHISQAALGEVKNIKAANYVPIHLKVEDKKFVIGTLSAERGPQIAFDLVFEKKFELWHEWKDGSIYFCGYTADEQDDGQLDRDSSDEDDEDDSEEDEIMLKNFSGKPGKPASDTQVAKPAESKAAITKAGSSAKPKVTLVEPEKEESDDGSDDESDDDLEDDSDDDMSEDEETPKKAKPSKKRLADSAIKTPASTKKANTGTPQKTDGKKVSGHTATPHPSKKTEKRTAQTPKSSSSVSCKTCSKTFNSEKGLESHSKAKHGGK